MEQRALALAELEALRTKITQDREVHLLIKGADKTNLEAALFGAKAELQSATEALLSAADAPR